jgi:desulfoferrodoxin-like iron-binding protein
VLLPLIFAAVKLPHSKKERRAQMAVKKEGEKYKCLICGNEVVVTKVGGGSLVCCGKNMKLLDE